MTKILLIGMMGAGKTTVGQALSQALNFKFVDMDTFLETKKGMTISEIFGNFGEAQFRIWEKEALCEIVNKDFDLVSTGGGIILDEENRVLIKEKSFCVFLNATVETLTKRLARDDSRPLLKKESLEDLYQKRVHLYEAVSDYTIFTDGMEIEAIVAKIIEVLNENSIN